MRDDYTVYQLSLCNVIFRLGSERVNPLFESLRQATSSALGILVYLVDCSSSGSASCAGRGMSRSGSPPRPAYSQSSWSQLPRWSDRGDSDPNVTETIRRKDIFDVTSVGQRSSPWSCKSMKIGVKFHLESKPGLTCARFRSQDMQ